MSIVMCCDGGEQIDTDYDSGQFIGDDKYYCEFCISFMTDEECKALGIER